MILESLKPFFACSAGHVLRGIILMVTLILAPQAADAKSESEGRADVLVYGATPGGIAAAVAAAKGGHEVLLVEPTSRIGGLVTCGLTHSDFRSFEALSGFFLDFSERVLAYYRNTYGADSAQAADSWRGTHGEPSVNLRVMEAMIAEWPSIRVLKQRQLIAVKTGPFLAGRRRLVSAAFATSEGTTETLAAQLFIDGSYEGDLMAMAGENFHVGRESRAQYGEPLAGDEQGRADGQVQGYNFRLCMTQVESNKLKPTAPANYRRGDFTGVLPLIQSGKLKKVFDSGHDGIYRAHDGPSPNGKFDVNDAPNAPARLSMPDLNDEWPTGDVATRQRIFEAHLYYHVGLLFFLQNDGEVPAGMRAEASAWGWCKDEFTETGGIPPQLYVREGRRLTGQHVFTANDTRTAPGDARAVLHRDSIASGDYIHNCHGTGRTGSRFDGAHTGQFFEMIQPYQISYGVIVPQITENLLVPVACSASHFGFGALRLEPIWTSLGQAAGWAAHLALTGKTSVQEVKVSALQERLHEDRSATLYVTDVPPASPDFAAVQWWGNQGGFHGLVQLEKPRKSRKITGQYCGAFPDHAAELDQPLTPALRARWEKLLPPGTTTLPVDVMTRSDWIRCAFLQRGRP